MDCSESAYSEDPEALRRAVAAGARQGRRAEVVVEPDRVRAFAIACAAVQPGDVVIVAGRGADQAQVAGEQVRPFDDRTVLTATLAHMGWRATGCQPLAKAAPRLPAGHTIERP